MMSFEYTQWHKHKPILTRTRTRTPHNTHAHLHTHARTNVHNRSDSKRLRLSCYLLSWDVYPNSSHFSSLFQKTQIWIFVCCHKLQGGHSPLLRPCCPACLQKTSISGQIFSSTELWNLPRFRVRMKFRNRRFEVDPAPVMNSSSSPLPSFTQRSCFRWRQRRRKRRRRRQRRRSFSEEVCKVKTLDWQLRPI